MCHGPHKELKSKKVEKNKDDIRAEQNMEKESGGQENKKGRDRERGEWGGGDGGTQKRKKEDRGRITEDRERMTEDTKRKTEDRERMTEDRERATVDKVCKRQ